MQCERRTSRSYGFRLIHLLAGLTGGRAVSNGSFLNLNIKSRALSNLLQDGNGGNHTLFSQEVLRDAFDKMLHVDFSGRIQTKVIGPSADSYHESCMGMTDTMDPLFETKGSNIFPSLFLGCHYDFARSRLGPISIDGALRWVDKQRPFLVELRNKRDLLLMTYSQEYVLQRSLPDRSPIRLLAECARGCHLSRLSCLLPLHRRINYEVQLQTSSNNYNPQHVQDDPIQNQDWWLPNVSIRPSGTMESLNSAVVRHPLHNNNNNNNNARGNRQLGIRFMIRRQLNWSAFSSVDPSSGDDTGTSLVFELREVGGQQASSVHLRLQTLFERPLESLHLTVTQTLMTRRPKI